MTLRPLPRARLDRVLPPLLQDCALVALVPVAADAHWSAEVAWGVARAATTGSHDTRRVVALVDLSLESPQLHLVKGLDPAPGIAEAIASDTSLTQVARDIDGVYFLPAGTDIPSPDLVRGSARWGRLQTGFRREDALLLVYLPAERLAELGATPDGLIALSLTGVDLGSSAGRALLAARERGSELLGVVRERWTAPQPEPLTTRRLRRGRPSIVALSAVLAVASVALFATAKQSFLGTAKELPGATAGASSPARSAVPPSAAPTHLVAPVPVLPALASGAWTVQLAAYGAPERALAHADRLAAAGLPAFVSPLAPDASGTVWYRVQAGAFATREVAAAARQRCRRRGLAAPGEGELLLAPYSLTLAHPADSVQLRGAGFVPVRWGDRGPVLVGAFERPEQAGVAVAQLDRAGIPTKLITRTEPIP